MAMLRRITLLATITLTLSACPAEKSQGSEPAAAARCAEAGRISGVRAKALVEKGATLLDVRTPGEFSSRHLPGAKNIPVDVVASRLSEVPKVSPVVVYCQSGNRSRTAAATLREAGYEVHDLGGIADIDTTDC